MRVLIVDDEEMERLALRRFLAKRDFTVFEASDGAVALEVMETEHVEAVITDLRMPNLDGIGLLKAIKDRKLDTEVILITAYMDMDSAIEATRSRAYDYIRKPYNLSEILQVLKRIESEREYRRLLMEKQKQIERNRWLSALGAVSTGIMHEFNNPNTIILGHIDHLKVLLAALFQRSPALTKAMIKEGVNHEEILNSFETIRAASERIAEITRRATLFRLSDMEKRHTFDVRAALTQALSRIQPGEKISGRHEIPARPFEIFGHAEMLSLAIGAILENALDAVRGQEPAEVHATIVAGAEEEIRIEITNNGAPIPEEIRGKVFDPFVTSKGDRPGRGLGLFIAERIAADHAGRIEHKTLPDGRTLFAIVVPGAKKQ
jgi:C4-dicarboxylate-specific signal transduction histidine kinase